MEHLVPGTDIGVLDHRGGQSLPWTSADPGSFAWSVLHHRHPVLVDTARAAHPYDGRQSAALDQLLDESTAGVLQPLPAERHDSAAWAEWTSSWVGQRWDAIPFLGAESYFYRRLLDAVDFFRPGPWFWVDPFAHQKEAELADPGLVDVLAALDDLPVLSPHDRATALLTAAVWGNKADLSFAAHQSSSVNPATRDTLLVDQTDRLLTALTDRRGPVAFVADNAGRELLADLVLIDDLLTSERAATVMLHLKPTPYYVSDATTHDLASCLRRLDRAGNNAARIAGRLRDAFRTGRIQIRTDWFYCAPLEYTAMPGDLAAGFAAASITILKGDLNYRRVFGDRHWPATTPTTRAAGYFPGPFAVLRTLKSDVVVGLPDTLVEDLALRDEGWRTSGSHALLQFIDPPGGAPGR